MAPSISENASAPLSPVYKHTSIRQIDTLHWVLGSGLIKDWSIAIDGGANIGEWAQVMAGRFQTVHAFEPGGMFQATASNIILHECALLDRRTWVTLNRKGNSRGWWVRPGGGDIRATTVDALQLNSCGFIKLDLEGADGLALVGASKTITQYRPVVMVEMGKQHRKRAPHISSKDIRRFLHERGYLLARRVESDYIFVGG